MKRFCPKARPQLPVHPHRHTTPHAGSLSRSGFLRSIEYICRKGVVAHEGPASLTVDSARGLFAHLTRRKADVCGAFAGGLWGHTESVYRRGPSDQHRFAAALACIAAYGPREACGLEKPKVAQSCASPAALLCVMGVAVSELSPHHVAFTNDQVDTALLPSPDAGPPCAAFQLDGDHVTGRVWLPPTSTALNGRGSKVARTNAVVMGRCLYSPVVSACLRSCEC